jgi:hypothetical protein
MSPSSNQIPVEMVITKGWTIRYEIHKLINSIWNKEELPHQWKVSIFVPKVRYSQLAIIQYKIFLSSSLLLKM